MDGVMLIRYCLPHINDTLSVPEPNLSFESQACKGKTHVPHATCALILLSMASTPLPDRSFPMQTEARRALLRRRLAKIVQAERMTAVRREKLSFLLAAIEGRYASRNALRRLYCGPRRFPQHIERRRFLLPQHADGCQMAAPGEGDDFNLSIEEASG